MFTMVASSATISWATAITTRASQRVSRPARAGAVVVLMTCSLEAEEISPVERRQVTRQRSRDVEEISPVPRLRWAGGRPATRLRADARRNEEQVLQAAREKFVERGIDCPLEEIARRAGVGIGTLYRRFGDRDGLVKAVLVDALELSLRRPRRRWRARVTAWRGWLATCGRCSTCGSPR